MYNKMKPYLKTTNVHSRDIWAKTCDRMRDKISCLDCSVHLYEDFF